jgi:nucleoside-diphosphate-sugar epimerase
LGAKGGIGLWTAHNLIQTDHNVNVVCRNEQKLKDLFGSKKDKFKNVINMDIEESVINYEKENAISSNSAKNPFLDHLEGIDIVINTVGASKTKDVNHSRIIDLETTKLLIEAAKHHSVKKFILVTSQFITRPDSFIAFILNTMVGNCLGHKLQAENLLRESGLNYTIVRPGGLKGEKMDKLENENSMPDEQANIL